MTAEYSPGTRRTAQSSSGQPMTAQARLGQTSSNQHLSVQLPSLIQAQPDEKTAIADSQPLTQRSVIKLKKFAPASSDESGDSDETHSAQSGAEE